MNQCHLVKTFSKGWFGFRKLTESQICFLGIIDWLKLMTLIPELLQYESI